MKSIWQKKVECSHSRSWAQQYSSYFLHCFPSTKRYYHHQWTGPQFFANPKVVERFAIKLIKAIKFENDDWCHDDWQEMFLESFFFFFICIHLLQSFQVGQHIKNHAKYGWETNSEQVPWGKMQALWKESHRSFQRSGNF